MPTPPIPAQPYMLLTGAEFTDRIPASQNITTQAPFRQCLRNAMTLHIKPVLGEALYNDLMAAYRAFREPPKTPMSEEYQALLPYVQDALAWYTDYLWVRHNYAPTRETGTTNLQGQGVVKVDSEEIRRKEQEALQYGQQYEAHLVKFLGEYASSYPLWQNGGCSAPAPDNSNGFFVLDVKEDSISHSRYGRRFRR